MNASRRMLLKSGGALGLAGFLAAHPLKALAATGIPQNEFKAPQPFSFDILDEEARRIAHNSYEPPINPSPNVLAAIDYDQAQRVRYRADRTVHVGDADHYPLQFFHLNKYAHDPVRISLVEGGQARELIYNHDLFEIPAGHPAEDLRTGAGFAGFRIMAEDLKTDWFAAIGASYFRSSAPYNQYGLSARGLAINTATSKPEEFPRFKHYWLEASPESDGGVIIYALLDGPSVAGAYRMQTKRVQQTNGTFRIEMEIEARLHIRADIDHIGIAPFSSMFWYGEDTRQEPRDWRPEIHDSDGLAILTGNGERIWRPIINPPHVMTNAFSDRDPKGFGLLQRDRNFDHYMDDGVFYEKRPSVWVEPLDAWGEGAVHLIELPTDTETWDNIVAFWVPKEKATAGQRRVFRYRLSWLDDIPFPEKLAQTVGTWSGIGGPPGLDFNSRPVGTRKFVIDFAGEVFEGLDRSSGVELVVNTSRGSISDIASYPVVGQRHRWRAMFDLKQAGAGPIDLRAYLRRGDAALSETWLYQYFPASA
ncbi:glucan biosynthesis protein [Hyphomicrobium sp.]|uniref:glucan biosynthesis protein n=1 Tax=Hyphomicrobium sp. TaxID=82 RepID=UPI002D777060|nr:glucan biosynthesis protein [Hyphomicrobium sp.]HET6389128.1 glucan biosynthesis protein [Hyphomicrobium sp.]